MSSTWRTKTWYNVVAPSYFGNVEIASTPSSTIEKLVGRVIETSLYDLTGDFSLAHVKLYFKVKEIRGSNAVTSFKGHDFARDYLRSLVRRGSSRIAGIFDVTTKDGYKLRATSIAFSVGRARTSQKKIIRAIMKDIVEKKGKDLKFDSFVQEAVLGKIGSEIYNEAKKTLPLRKCEITKTKLLREPGVT
ncbi:MAG: 30S ribosomal protein S3ae [Promethearchaeati archaeon SRVP18_Atabeyarchaeia-1]